MNIRNEIRSIQAMSKGRQRTLAVFLATVLFWWGMMNFAQESPFAFWSFLPMFGVLLFIVYAYPTPEKAGQDKNGEQGGQE